jgi:hypothetical protein
LRAGAELPGRHARHNRKFLYGLGHHGASANLCASANSDTGQYNRTDPDVNVVFDHYLREVDTAVEDGLLGAFFAMLGGDDLHAWANAYIFSDGQATGAMKEALLTNPGS